MGKLSSFRRLPKGCCQGEDLRESLRLCTMLRVDIRVGGNTIKIAENDYFIESLHDLHMISLEVKGV